MVAVLARDHTDKVVKVRHREFDIMALGNGQPQFHDVVVFHGARLPFDVLRHFVPAQRPGKQRITPKDAV